MKLRILHALCGLTATLLACSFANGATLILPDTIPAGSAFSIQTTGSGTGTLYIFSTGHVLKRDVQLGQTTYFAPGSLFISGHYLAVVTGHSFTETGSFDVLPETKPAQLSFIAKPSRLPVGLHNGITGAVYVFDTYYNLVLAPTLVSFELAGPSGTIQKRDEMAHFGAVWTEMDSTNEQGNAKFVARAGDISSSRVVGQVPGDPCGLRMSAQRSSQQVQLVTDPVRDCHGNAVPDGTIVTFTASYNGLQSTIDQPIKHGTAQITLSAPTGAMFSVASGVAMGNQIRWEK